jgi:hypothetical protein
LDRFALPPNHIIHIIATVPVRYLFNSLRLKQRCAALDPLPSRRSLPLLPLDGTSEHAAEGFVSIRSRQTQNGAERHSGGAVDIASPGGEPTASGRSIDTGESDEVANRRGRPHLQVAARIFIRCRLMAEVESPLH